MKRHRMSRSHSRANFKRSAGPRSIHPKNMQTPGLNVRGGIRL